MEFQEYFKALLAQLPVRLFFCSHTALEERTVQVPLYGMPANLFEPAVQAHFLISIRCMVILACPVLPGVCLIIQEPVSVDLLLQEYDQFCRAPVNDGLPKALPAFVLMYQFHRTVFLFYLRQLLLPGSRLYPLCQCFKIHRLIGFTGTVSPFHSI